MILTADNKILTRQGSILTLYESEWDYEGVLTVGTLALRRGYEKNNFGSVDPIEPQVPGYNEATQIYWTQLSPRRLVVHDQNNNKAANEIEINGTTYELNANGEYLINTAVFGLTDGVPFDIKLK